MEEAGFGRKPGLACDVMRINTNFAANGVDATLSPRPAASAAPRATDGASFAGADALDTSMSMSPDSRPEAVDRAKALINDPNYPSPEVLRGVANLLAATTTPVGE
jgi:hypothetical protein